MPKLPGFKHIPADIVRQREHFKRIDKLTSNLLDMEVRHGDDIGNIELDTCTYKFATEVIYTQNLQQSYLHQSLFVFYTKHKVFKITTQAII